MEPTRFAAGTLWAALAFTWLAASAPARKEPTEPAPAAATQAESGARSG
ncbi:MAG TPA: hypothetical protein VGM87_18250 [Roseomonas sp.]